MKKIVIIAFVITGFIANAQVRNYNKNNNSNSNNNNNNRLGLVTKSQPKENKQFSEDSFGSKIGIVGGLLFSDEVGDGIESSSSKSGFYAGLSYKSEFSEKLALQVDLVYATMGAEFQDLYTDELDYIQLPITINVKLLKIVTLQAGPQIGYLVTAQIDGEDYIDSLNTIDYGVVGGVGIAFPNTNFGFSAKYYYGLANINNQDSSLGKITNTSYSIGAFYYF